MIYDLGYLDLLEIHQDIPRRSSCIQTVDSPHQRII